MITRPTLVDRSTRQSVLTEIINMKDGRKDKSTTAYYMFTYNAVQ